jgi:hypothetical protein
MNEECSFCYLEECECEPCEDCGSLPDDCLCGFDDWYDEEEDDE